MIGVIDYGVANLGSMLNMLRKVGAQAERVRSAAELERVTKVILPGIGAFDQGMAALAQCGLVEPLRALTANGVPLLGVCLGMQMLGNGSEEGQRPGLGVIDGECRRLRMAEGSRLKVPHMGWNRLQPARHSDLLRGLDDQSRFYFVHSYHLVCADESDVLAHSAYGVDFVSMVQRGNIYGAQFHPEKSHRFGMTLLRNFTEL